MAATVNETLRDLAISHQIDVHRLTTGTAGDVQAVIDGVKDDIVAAIARNDPTPPGGYSKARLQAMLSEISQINGAAYSKVSELLDSHLLDVAQYEADYQAQAITASVPPAIPVDLAAPAAATIVQGLAEPVQGATVGDWISALEANATRQIGVGITIGAVNGDNVGQLIARVVGSKSLNFKDGVFAMLARRTDSTTRTLVNAAASVGREAFYSQNSDLIDSVQWISTLDSRTCEVCGDLDGEIFPIDEGQRPPEHWSCRCTTAACVKSWTELGIDAKDIPEGTRASMSGQVSAKITYPSWLKNQSASVQDDALGPTRGVLFRRGAMPISRFVDTTGRQYTLDELRQRDASAFKKAGLE